MVRVDWLINPLRTKSRIVSINWHALTNRCVVRCCSTLLPHKNPYAKTQGNPAYSHICFCFFLLREEYLHILSLIAFTYLNKLNNYIIYYITYVCRYSSRPQTVLTSRTPVFSEVPLRHPTPLPVSSPTVRAVIPWQWHPFHSPPTGTASWRRRQTRAPRQGRGGDHQGGTTSRVHSVSSVTTRKAASLVYHYICIHTVFDLISENALISGHTFFMRSCQNYKRSVWFFTCKDLRK